MWPAQGSYWLEVFDRPPGPALTEVPQELLGSPEEIDARIDWALRMTELRYPERKHEDESN